MSERVELNGSLIIDKPKDISSAAVVSKVKKILKVKKAGHAGTLDPFATGILICCINRGTKLSRFLLKQDKVYEASLRLGIITDTEDLTGNVIAVNKVDDFKKEDILNAVKNFIGEIKQVPPVYSALKHSGETLYKLARAGKPIYKPARKVFIEYIEITDIELPYIKFDIKCSSGTYIRKIASDIGDKLGCGAHLTELRRTAVGKFSIKNASTIEELIEKVSSGREKEVLINLNDTVSDMPYALVSETLKSKILNVKKLTLDDINPEKYNFESKEKNFLKIIDKNNRLIAIISLSGKTYDYCSVFN